MRAYAQDLADFARFAGPDSLARAIEPAVILAFLDDLRGRRGRKPRTIRRRLACLKAFLKHLQRSGHIVANPFAELDLVVPVPQVLPRSLSLDEVTRLARASQRPPLGRQAPGPQPDTTTRLALLLLCATGMRVGELTRLTLEDVDPASGTIRILGKGSRERTAFVTEPALLESLRRQVTARRRRTDGNGALLLNRKGTPLTAQALRLRLHRLSERAGLRRRVTPHMLRHTAATLLLEAGVDIRFVQRLLGHRSITTTELYTHVSNRSLRTALERAEHMEGVAV